MHNLNFNQKTGKYSFFGLGPAWHNLGVNVEAAQTSEEAIKLSGLDYEVVKRKMVTAEGGLDVPDHNATVRTDTNEVLGVVGNRYSILPNKTAFKFIDELVGKKEAIFHSAGALGKGERIFVTCKLPQRMLVGQNDVADLYFFLTNSHDGTRAVEMAFTPTFIVCENTLRMALEDAKRKQRLRHTANIYSGMIDAASIMGITKETIEAKTELFNAMSKVQINDEQLRKFIELAMKPAKEQIEEEEFSTRFVNTVDEILEYALTDEAQLITERKGNLWGAYNSITGFFNNVEEYTKPEQKLKSIMYGNGFAKGEKAMSLALNVLSNKITLS